MKTATCASPRASIGDASRTEASVKGLIALDELFLDLSRRVYNYAFCHVRDAGAADDIVSTVFERVLRSLSRFDPTRASAPDWVFAIAANAVRDHFRTQRRRRLVSLEAIGDVPSPDPSAEEAVLGDEMTERLLSAVGRLEPREREIVALRFAGGLSNVAIARICRIRAGNVAVIVHRTVQKLRRQILHAEDQR